jgi:hypothetical protein
LNKFHTAYDPDVVSLVLMEMVIYPVAVTAEVCRSALAIPCIKKFREILVGSRVVTYGFCGHTDTREENYVHSSILPYFMYS